jgi:hypothetical protein
MNLLFTSISITTTQVISSAEQTLSVVAQCKHSIFASAITTIIISTGNISSGAQTFCLQVSPSPPPELSVVQSKPYW